MPRQIPEANTRKEMKVPQLDGGIDPQLEKAGWYLRAHRKAKIEILPVPLLFAGVDGYDTEPWNGGTDYRHLWLQNGEVLVLPAPVPQAQVSFVEGSDVWQAEAQFTYYVNEIEKHQSFKPFGFPASGLEIYFVGRRLCGQARSLWLFHAGKPGKAALPAPACQTAGFCSS